MKKLLLVILVVLVGSPLLFGQLTEIEADFSALMQGLADEIQPYIQQDALNADGIGAASLGDSHFYLSLSAGGVLTNGIFTFRSDPNYFDLLDVGGLLELLVAPILPGDLYDLVETMFLLPTARIGLGFRFPLDIELLLTFSMVPQELTDALLDMLITDSAARQLLNLSFTHMNIGGRIRKTLVRDTEAFPALSVGAGYTYGNFSFSYPLQFIQSLGEGDASADLVLDGDIGINTTVHTAGIDVAISKKLAIFVPFLNVGAWYQWNDFTAGGNFSAEIVGPDDVPLVEETLAPSGARSTEDLAILINAGFEIALGPFHLVPEATFNTATGTLSAQAAMRFQF